MLDVMNDNEKRSGTYEVSFNSRVDLERQIRALIDRGVRLNETQLALARSRAMKMDNNEDTVGERVTCTISHAQGARSAVDWRLPVASRGISRHVIG
jgi:predicted DNA-binding protein (UPF0278 family)